MPQAATIEAWGVLIGGIGTALAAVGGLVWRKRRSSRRRTAGERRTQGERRNNRSGLKHSVSQKDAL